MGSLFCWAETAVSSKLLELIIKLKDEASAGLSSLQSTLGSVGGFLKGAFTAALVGAAVAIGGLGVQSISIAGDFQQGMSVLQAASGATASQMDALSAKAMELGNDITLPAASASDAATAMQELAKAGLSVDDTMAAAQGTLQLAAAAGTDAATAATAVAGALNTFGLEGNKANQVADQLAAGANASAASMTDLSQGFQAAGFAFASTGQHSDDLVSALAMLTNVGLTGSDAGTALKNAMMQLMAPTDAAAATMKQYGINVRDAQGNMLPFRDIIGVLQTGLGGLSPAARDAALKTILMGDGMKAMIPLLDAGVAGFDAMKVKVNEAGAAQDMAAAQTSGFNGALGSIKNGIETLQLAIGMALLPVLTRLITEGISPVIGAVSEVVGALIEAGIGSSEFAESMDLVGQAIGLPANMLQNIVIGLQNFATAMVPVGGFIQSNLLPILAGFGAMILAVVIPAFITWAAAAWATAAANVAALAPILIPILLIGAAVALLVAAWQNNFLGIRDITASVWATIQPYFDQLVAWLSVAIPAAIQAAAQLWTGTLWPALQAVGNFIVGTVIPALSQVAAWLATNIPAAIQAVIVGFGQFQAGAMLVWAVIQTAWQNVVTTTTTAWANVTTVVQAGISAVVTDVQTRIAVVTTIVQAVWNTVVFLTSAAWNAIVGAVSPGVQQVVAVLQSGWATLTSIVANVWAGIVAVVGPAMATIATAVLSGVAAVQAAWSAGWAVVQSVASSVWATIQSVVAAAVASVQSTIQSVISFIQSVWGVAQQAAQTQTTAAWAAIQTIITGAMLAVKIAIQVGVAVVQGIMATAWAVVVAAANNDFGKIPAIISAGLDKVKAILQAGVSMITAVAGTMAAAALSLGKNIVSGIISGVGSMGNALGDKLKSMANSALSAAKSALGIHSPSTVMAQQVGVPIIDGIVMGIDKASPKVTDKMLDLAGKMVDLVSKGVDAFGKLRELGTVSMSSIAQFANTLQDAMNVFATMAMSWNATMQSAASQFALKASTIVDTMAKAVDFLLKLQDFQGVPSAVITAFGLQLGQAISELIKISTIQMRMAMGAAVEFSLGAGKVLGVMGSAVDGLNKLRTLGDAVPGSFARFALYMAVAVQRVAEVATWIDGPALASASQFAEGGGKVLGILGTGVDGFTKLATMGEAVPGMFQRFAIQVFALVQRMAEVAGWMSAQAVASAAVFADGAGKVIAIIGSGVDGFLKLTTFQGISKQSMDAFAVAVQLAVATIGYIGSLFAVEGVAAAAVFADGAVKIVALIGGGVDSLVKLASFQGVTQDMLNIFAHSIQITVATIGWVATLFTVDAVAAAVAFSAGVQSTIGMITSTLDAFGKLASFQGVAGGVLDQFVSGLTGLVNEIARQIFPAATNIGINLSNGIANGITSGIPAIQNAVNRAVNAALQAAYAALGIASPSKVFDEMVGQQAGAGLAQGLDASIPAVETSAGNLASAAVTPAVVAVGPRTAAPASSPAVAGGGGGGLTGNLYVTINQQPGESAEQLLNKMIPLLERKLGLKVR